MVATIKVRTRARKSGALLTLAGLLAVVVSFFVAGPASSADNGTSPVCNNQHGNASDCQGASYHGHVDWQFEADGDLVFHVVGENGWQWSGLFVCIPYAGPTQPADCTGSDNPLVPGTDYTVTGVSGLSNGAKNASFNCDGDFTATVNANAIDDVADPVNWALHVSACNGGSDEAFGASTHTGATTTTSTSTSSTSTTTSTSTTSTSTTSTTEPEQESTTTTTEQEQESTTTTTEPEVEETTTTTEPEVEASTSTVPDDTTTTTVVVGGVNQTQDPEVQGVALAATGSETQTHVAVAGLALILGGLAVMFGERTKRAATR
jgi:hypothetical protein